MVRLSVSPLLSLLWVVLLGTHCIGTSALSTSQPAADLITRVVGVNRAGSFHLHLLPSPPGVDLFVLSSSPKGNITIGGSSSVALASGFHWYLKYYANLSLLYGVVNFQETDLPPVWPGVPHEVSMESPVQWRYYMNVVTHSYSAAWWDWSRWEREIDWMAMMGINMPLAFTGQEWVWYRVYTERFGLTDADLSQHFAGPAFLAWGRMGNIRGWGGIYEPSGITGLTMNWMRQQAALQKQIVQRERALGMSTVLPAFAGHVPWGLNRNGTKHNISRGSGWCGFNQEWSGVGLLEPSDPLFHEIGRALVEIQTAEYGTDHFYNGDTFNEEHPRTSDPTYIASWGSAVYNALAAVDPAAVWLIQGWSLHGWPTAELQAYWSHIPDGRLVCLDLGCASSSSSWVKFVKDVKPPRPVICGLLTNMGGRRRLGAPLAQLSNQTIRNVEAAGHDSTGHNFISGLGWNPEDLHSNPIKWQLMGEVAWRGTNHLIDNIPDWVRSYATRRNFPSPLNEKLMAAWDILGETVYSRGASVGFDADGLCRLPAFPLRGGISATHNTSALVAAWRLFVEAEDASLARSAGYRYDLVDVGRQVLQDHFVDLYNVLEAVKDNCEGTDFTRQEPYNHTNCKGAANPADRLPGCGMDTKYKTHCDVDKMKAWCLGVQKRDPHSGECVMFNTNGYLYTRQDGTEPFNSYTLDCYVRTLGPTCRHAINVTGEAIINLALDLDRLLSTESQFLLGRWLKDARQWGATDPERAWLEWNARSQITMWGSKESDDAAISDYAAKQWGGLVAGYYVPLWRYFIQQWSQPTGPTNNLRDKLLTLAGKWTNATNTYPVDPVGDPVLVSKELLAKYTPSGTIVAGYDAKPGVTITPSSLKSSTLVKAVGAVPGEVGRACDASPMCTGFTMDATGTNAILLTHVSDTTSHAGKVLYVKK